MPFGPIYLSPWIEYLYWNFESYYSKYKLTNQQFLKTKNIYFILFLLFDT